MSLLLHPRSSGQLHKKGILTNLISHWVDEPGHHHTILGPPFFESRVFLCWWHRLTNDIIIFSPSTDKHGHRLWPLEIVMAIELVSSDRHIGNIPIVWITITIDDRWFRFYRSIWSRRRSGRSNYPVICYRRDLSFRRGCSDTMKKIRMIAFFIFLDISLQ